MGWGLARGDEAGTAIFIGAALVATSVGITSAVLIELQVLDRRASRTILGAAVVDDVLALLLLAVATGLASEGSVDVVQVLAILALALSFLAFFALGGTRLLRSRPQLLHAPRFSESPLLPAVIVCLGLAAFAAQIGLAAIIGAFLAGMIVAETREHSSIEQEVAPLYAFFPPFFFAFIGTELDLGALIEPGALLLLSAVTLVAVVTKLGGAYVGARGLGGASAAFTAVGMVPRGEVGIIVAGIGAATGAIEEVVFAAIVGMSILTTLIVPPLLRRLASRLPDERAGEAARAEPEGAGSAA